MRTLRIRLPIAIVGLGLVSAATMGWIGWSGAKSALTSAASDKLSLAAETRRNSLELVEERLKVDAANLAAMKVVADNIGDLAEPARSLARERRQDFGLLRGCGFARGALEA